MYNSIKCNFVYNIEKTFLLISFLSVIIPLLYSIEYIIC